MIGAIFEEFVAPYFTSIEAVLLLRLANESQRRRLDIGDVFFED